MADYALFIAAFPEFASTSEPPVDYWLGQAVTTLSPWRLGQNYGLACMLFAAHNLTLGAIAAAAQARGASPGSPPAPITGKGAGGLSVSYDPGLTATDDAGIYNATSYGQRLWKLLQSAAMGGLYVAPPPRRHVFGYGNSRRLY